MSANFRIRKNKNCLNCGHIVPETFCSHCGQPNREPVLTITDIFHDFIHMLTHFDGKFFQTVRILFTRPGFLTRAYLDGKRIQYLPPVQLYVFTSALFFFIFYSFMVKIPTTETLNNKVNLDQLVESRQPVINLSTSDSALAARLKTPEDYLRYQDSLPKESRDGYFTRLLKANEIKLNNRISENNAQAIYDLITDLMKNIPKLLFISLPIMAFILQVLFYKKKGFGFVAHILFLLHIYIFTLLVILLSYLFNQFSILTSWSIFSWISIGLIFWIFYYAYRAMKNLYKISRRRATFSYLIFLCCGLFVFLLLFVGDILFTILTL